MADAEYALTNQPVQFDATGPYWLTNKGRKSYVPPTTAGEMARRPGADPRLVAFAAAHGVTAADPNGTYGDLHRSYLRGQPFWNPATGGYDQDINYGNLLSTAVGAGLGAGAISAIGGAGAAGGGSAAASGSGATGAGAVGTGAAGTAGATGAAGVGGVGAAGAAGTSILEKLKQVVTSPGDLASLAALIPTLSHALGGGGTNPFTSAGLQDEITKSLALQRQRVEQTQPEFDTLVRMAYGAAPTQYRGAPPDGYQPNPAPSGAYQFKAPTFGGR